MIKAPVVIHLNDVNDKESEALFGRTAFLKLTAGLALLVVPFPSAKCLLQEDEFVFAGSFCHDKLAAKTRETDSTK